MMLMCSWGQCGLGHAQVLTKPWSICRRRTRNAPPVMPCSYHIPRLRASASDRLATSEVPTPRPASETLIGMVAPFSRAHRHRRAIRHRHAATVAQYTPNCTASPCMSEPSRYTFTCSTTSALRVDVAAAGPSRWSVRRGVFRCSGSLGRGVDFESAPGPPSPEWFVASLL
jgi:hypothetical protein